MAKSNRMSSNQARYICFVADHPGCCVADVNRRCRHNPQAGHKWVYDGVARLVRRGLLKARYSGNRKLLYTPEAYPVMVA